MKKYKNVLLSLGFFILAPVWIFLSKYIFNMFNTSPYVADELFVWVYIIFFITGIFFGFKNRAQTPSLLGNIILIIGIIVLLPPLLFYYWAAGWSA